MLYVFITALLAGLSLIIYIAHQNTKDVQIKNISIDSNVSNTDHELALKILHLSDLHLENISVTPEILKQRIDNMDIDLIALTGDFLDRKKTIPELAPYLKVLGDVRPKYGTYVVFGNHDYVLDADSLFQVRTILENHGCKVLQNKHERIMVDGKPVNIIGIDDYYTQRSNVERSFANLLPGYNLILTHDPSLVLDMKEDYTFDYLLSGHFHGGQICWPKPYHMVKMGRLIKKNIVKGLHYIQGKPVYISEGLGQTGVNLRIGSRPEITLHNIQVDKSA